MDKEISNFKFELLKHSKNIIELAMDSKFEKKKYTLKNISKGIDNFSNKINSDKIEFSNFSSLCRVFGEFLLKEIFNFFELKYEDTFGGCIKLFQNCFGS